MAYTNQIDPATPPFDGFVGQGDDQLRQLKADLIERMNTLVEDFNADPLVLSRNQVGGSGTVVAHHSQFAINAVLSTYVTRNISYSSLTPAGSSSIVGFGLVNGMSLPVGVQLQNAYIKVDSPTTIDTVACTLYKMNIDGEVETPLGTFSATAGGGIQQIPAVGLIPLTVGQSDIFSFAVTLSRLAKLYSGTLVFNQTA